MAKGSSNPSRILTQEPLPPDTSLSLLQSKRHSHATNLSPCSFRVTGPPQLFQAPPPPGTSSLSFQHPRPLLTLFTVTFSRFTIGLGASQGWNFSIKPDRAGLRFCP